MIPFRSSRAARDQTTRAILPVDASPPHGGPRCPRSAPLLLPTGGLGPAVGICISSGPAFGCSGHDGGRAECRKRRGGGGGGGQDKAATHLRRKPAPRRRDA